MMKSKHYSGPTQSVFKSKNYLRRTTNTAAKHKKALDVTSHTFLTQALKKAKYSKKKITEKDVMGGFALKTPFLQSVLIKHPFP